MLIPIFFAVNLLLLLVYKGSIKGSKFQILTHGWSVFVHELLHYIPAKILGIKPKFIWGSVDIGDGRSGLAAVQMTGTYGSNWSFSRDWIISCSTYLLPAATICVIPFVDYISALYLGWVTVRCYLASHYDEQMHYERIFMAQFHGWK